MLASSTTMMWSTSSGAVATTVPTRSSSLWAGTTTATHMSLYKPAPPVPPRIGNEMGDWVRIAGSRVTISVPAGVVPLRGRRPGLASRHDVGIPGGPPLGSREPGARPWVATAALLATLVWVVAALLMAGRGFDVTDEGFYVLSYRWWDSTPRVFTGVQYLYGPVFEALGWSIDGLAGLPAGQRRCWCTSRSAGRSWPGCGPVGPTRRPPLVGGRWGAHHPACSGGIVYGWMPLSPGYNDVVILTSLLLVSLLLWSHAGAWLRTGPGACRCSRQRAPAPGGSARAREVGLGRADPAVPAGPGRRWRLARSGLRAGCRLRRGVVVSVSRACCW